MIYEYVVKCDYYIGQGNTEERVFTYWDEADEWIEQTAIDLATDAIDRRWPAFADGYETLCPEWDKTFAEALDGFTIKERPSRTLKDDEEIQNLPQ